MDVNAFILDGNTWSYSRINTFETCPYQYYLQYIMGYLDSDNAFGEYGTFMHSILEKYYKGELNIFELEDYFEENYNTSVMLEFPPSIVDLHAHYYQKGLEYLQNFIGIDGKCLGVEQVYNFKVGEYDFKGIIDYEGETEGVLEIIDHKSKSEKDSRGRKLCKKRLTKNDDASDYINLIDGRFLNKEITRQLYLYCIPIKEKYGKYPTYLNVNMFRVNDWYRWEFNETDFEETKQWAVEIIDRIYKMETFLKGEFKDDYFCSYICGVAEYCKNSNKFMGIEG